MLGSYSFAGDSAVFFTRLTAPLFCSFPGLYETLHHKVRGQWDVDIWANYLSYRAKVTPLPWDPSVGDVDEARRKEIMQGIASKAGVAPEALFGSAAK